LFRHKDTEKQIKLPVLTIILHPCRLDIKNNF